MGSMESPADRVRVRLWIEGRVQGVFFRASTVEEAVRLKLKGWVRNCPDGSVEIVAEGEKAQVEKLARWCRQGPPGAHVHAVRVSWEDCRGEFRDFRITR